ncbi:hypothetical protein Agub_g8296 [Astrephomene gubernaculifera]|uniref:Glutamyl-tRNA amidotransferase n=1 Tax=Astrephomene gubernaculifera TaxID=47775 RepID=A0AAD3DRF2_9CHLO|nr:hypothetical protein Agub_g8296 [Astrephomene gubernaculifera]
MLKLGPASTRCCHAFASMACIPASARLSSAASIPRTSYIPHRVIQTQRPSHRFSQFRRQQRPLDYSFSRGFAAAAAAASDGAAAATLVDRIKADMKTAMKAKDQPRLEAIRFLNAAIKQREIELREGGGAVTDQEVVKVIQKLVKQRRDSIESYRSGGREDLVAKEQSELSLLEGYLPAMMGAAEVEQLVEQVIAELGLSGPKAMGPVMKAVMARAGGRADSKTVSDAAKARLAGGGK